MSRKQVISGWGIVMYGILLAVLVMPPNLSAQGEVELEVVKTHPGEAFAIRAFDLDSDGYDDIIYAGSIDAALHILYGKQDGTFETPVHIDMNADYFTEVYFNQDQLLDVVIFGPRYYYIVINEGEREFSVDSIPHEYNISGGIATGYFNDDSYVDIITSEGGLDNGLPDYHGVILYGDGSGGITETELLPYKAIAIYVCDFNNDYRDDFIAIGNYGIGRIILNLGNGDLEESATFDLGSLVLQGSATNPVADFNHDGNADFAFITSTTLNNFGSHVRVGYCDGLGGIDSIVTIPLPGQASHTLSISDINRDNCLDLLIPDITHRELDVFFSDSQGSFSYYGAVDLRSDSLMFSIDQADFNRDGNPDYVVGGYFYSDSINIIMNNLPPVNVLEPVLEVNAYNNVQVSLDNPGGFVIEKNYCTVAGGKLGKVDWNRDQALDERIVDRNLQYGTYNVSVKAKPFVERSGTFDAEIKVADEIFTLFKNHPVPASSSVPGAGSFDSFSIPFIFEEVSPIYPRTGEWVNRNVVLDWSGLGLSGTEFQIQLTDRIELDGTVIYDFSDIKGSSFRPEINFETGKVYYWRVKSDESDWQGPFAMYIQDSNCGDVDCDGTVGLFDIVHLVRYKFGLGAVPCDLNAADINGDGKANIVDIIGLINYSFLTGSAPECL